MQETQSSKNLSKENEVRGVILPNNQLQSCVLTQDGTEQSPDTCIYGQLKFSETGKLRCCHS